MPYTVLKLVYFLDICYATKNELGTLRHFITLILTHIRQHMRTFQLKSKIFSVVGD